MDHLDPDIWNITPRAAGQALDLGMSPEFIVRLLTEPSGWGEWPGGERELHLDGYSALIDLDPLGRWRVTRFLYGSFAPAAGLEVEAA